MKYPQSNYSMEISKIIKKNSVVVPDWQFVHAFGIWSHKLFWDLVHDNRSGHQNCTKQVLPTVKNTNLLGLPTIETLNLSENIYIYISIPYQFGKNTDENASCFISFIQVTDNMKCSHVICGTVFINGLAKSQEGFNV